MKNVVMEAKCRLTNAQYTVSFTVCHECVSFPDEYKQYGIRQAAYRWFYG